MITLTKEWLQQTIAELEEERNAVPGFVNVDAAMALAAMKLALTSLEAEAVCVIDQSNLDYLKSGADADVWPASRKEMGDVLLYRTAPPAPANAEPVAWLWSHRKHPSEVSLVRPEDDEKAEGAHWSGWSCQALYAAPPAPVSVPDEVISAIENLKRTLVNCNRYNYCSDAVKRIENACRAAMLQGAERTNYRAIVERIAEIIHGKVTDIDLLTVTVKSMKDKLQK
ncbi:TPA: hypothetical protein ND465_003051 [Enterobacter hormaechei]|uniref:hypothetical protein n=1 Tax=Enterobacter hormaechei TaxID=158836 RepID=UPI0006AC392D|nr:hypothetical protein [Enterobacter hormaechei]EHF5025789.1 hypothetical protein [Enterobacter hormaechei]KVK15805.1 hypothetical protein AWS18_04925 [Enterobacter hormaechei subsp. oharae]MXR95265.1 hypothetical protein [Enterobacter hormaechei]CZX38150.1 Uncharacterised protein [Enterobacter hormaechei]CZY83893.1 Uncharacterised protein [Enterobacter hormaechei]